MAQTLKIDVTNTGYTALTAGGEGITITIESTLGGGKLAIANSLPAANTDNYILLKNTDFPFTIPATSLEGTDIVYFRADRPNTVLRAIK